MALLDRIAKEDGTTQTTLVGMGVELPQKVQPMTELGVSGLLRTRGVGYVYDEWMAALSTYRAKQVYREMRDNDPVVGAMFFALEMILRKAEWHIEPAQGSKGDDAAEFLKTNMEDMSHTWEDFVAETVNMFVFGFSLFEIVYKRRQGAKGKRPSKYDDGLMGWRKFAPRAQETILYWIWDDEGGLQGAVQLAAPDFRTVALPIERLLLFRTTSVKNNPEGRSVLRNCYRPWFFKRRAEEVEGIGLERDLCGLPVLSASSEVIAQMGNGNFQLGMQLAKQLVTNVRIDDQAGIVLPLAYDENKNPLIKFELIRAAGSKQSNPDKTIARYDKAILNTMLAGFIQFGQSPTGSRSLHMSATQIFSLAISAFMDSIAAVINRIAIPRLWGMNGMDPDTQPKLVAGEVGVRDLNELATYIGQLSQAGLTFFDRPTSDYLRKTGGLPATPDEPDLGMVPPETANPNAEDEGGGANAEGQSHDPDTPSKPQPKTYSNQRPGQGNSGANANPAQQAQSQKV